MAGSSLTVSTRKETWGTSISETVDPSGSAQVKVVKEPRSTLEDVSAVLW
jgi:hypothetical protein